MKVGDIESYEGTVIRIFIFPEWAMEPGVEKKNYLLFLDDLIFPHEVVSDWYAEYVSRETARDALGDLAKYVSFYAYVEIFYRDEGIRKLVVNI